MTDSPSVLFGDGFGVALATPFLPDGQIDEPALIRLVQHVVGGGADFLVALGSTGEAPMLLEAERDRIVEIVREHRGQARLVVGTGASSTAQTVAWTLRARQLGANAALIAVPCYTKPTQAGIVAHFTAVATAATDLPLIAYNVPSRTGVNLAPTTVTQLWRLPTVVALKESSGDLLQIARIAADLPQHRLLLAGDDALTLPTIAVGGRGLVSVAGNVVPAEMRELVTAACSGDLVRAQACATALLPLFDALSTEPNPIPVKTALALVGIGGAEMRLPLLSAHESTRAALRAALHRLQGATSHA